MRIYHFRYEALQNNSKGLQDSIKLIESLKLSSIKKKIFNKDTSSTSGMLKPNFLCAYFYSKTDVLLFDSSYIVLQTSAGFKSWLLYS